MSLLQSNRESRSKKCIYINQQNIVRRFNNNYVMRN